MSSSCKKTYPQLKDDPFLQRSTKVRQRLEQIRPQTMGFLKISQHFYGVFFFYVFLYTLRIHVWNIYLHWD